MAGATEEEPKMTRPTHCRYCGAAITQAQTGRPKQFCCDAHGRLYGEIFRDLQPRQRPPFGVPLFHSADADRRLRALHAEMRSLTRSCYTVASELELAGDPINVARFTTAGAALERVLVENFADLEKS
jgi:hypothetical protein